MSDLPVIIGILLTICCVTWANPECHAGMTHTTHQMPDKNPLLFFICTSADDPIVIKCPKDTGFVATKTRHGCIKFANWPNAPKDRIPSCKKPNHLRLYRSIDPSRYFACKDEDSPILLKCNPGYGFTYTNNRVGCVPWIEWNVDDQINDDPEDV